jgi:two-component sensor histidine kinase
MVLHELATNAAKHGALSIDDGRVSVRWNRSRDANAYLRIEWQESGGPPVHFPRETGYGIDVIRNLVPYELGGTVDLAFPSEGLRCVISIPVTEASSSDRHERSHT